MATSRFSAVPAPGIQRRSRRAQLFDQLVIPQAHTDIRLVQQSREMERILTLQSPLIVRGGQVHDGGSSRRCFRRRRSRVPGRDRSPGAHGGPLIRERQAHHFLVAGFQHGSEIGARTNVHVQDRGEFLDFRVNDREQLFQSGEIEIELFFRNAQDVLNDLGRLVVLGKSRQPASQVQQVRAAGHFQPAPRHGHRIVMVADRFNHFPRQAPFFQQTGTHFRVVKPENALFPVTLSVAPQAVLARPDRPVGVLQDLPQQQHAQVAQQTGDQIVLGTRQTQVGRQFVRNQGARHGAFPVSLQTGIGFDVELHGRQRQAQDHHAQAIKTDDEDRPPDAGDLMAGGVADGINRLEQLAAQSGILCQQVADFVEFAIGIVDLLNDLQRQHGRRG